MTSKTADDILGLEFDWLGTDVDGCVGFFSTAGGGYAPPAFLMDTDAHEAAIAAVLAASPTTTARYAPTVAANLDNAWLSMAERGVFAYDSDYLGQPYSLVAEPRHPIHADELPEAARIVAERLHFGFRFQATKTVGPELLVGGEDPRSPSV